MSKLVFVDCPDEASESVKKSIAFLARVAATLVQKNQAYGDSVSSPVRVFSKLSKSEALMVRLDDKLSRIARGTGLSSGDEDVILDMVGYLALLHVALSEKENAP